DHGRPGARGRPGPPRLPAVDSLPGWGPPACTVGSRPSAASEIVGGRGCHDDTWSHVVGSPLVTTRRAGDAAAPDYLRQYGSNRCDLRHRAIPGVARSRRRRTSQRYPSSPGPATHHRTAVRVAPAGERLMWVRASRRPADPAAVGEHGVTAVREHGVTAVGEHGVAVANTAFRCGATVRIRYLAVHVTTHRRRAAGSLTATGGSGDGDVRVPVYPPPRVHGVVPDRRG